MRSVHPGLFRSLSLLFVRNSHIYMHTWFPLLQTMDVTAHVAAGGTKRPWFPVPHPHLTEKKLV